MAAPGVVSRCVGGRVAQPEVGAQVDDPLAGGQGDQSRLGRCGVGQAEEDDVGRVERRVRPGDERQARRGGKKIAQRLACLGARGDESDFDRGVALENLDQLPACVTCRTVDAGSDHEYSFSIK